MLVSPLRNRSAGFSLLELIIVLVIMGVLVASITISINDTRGDKLHFEARRLTARLSLALDEAVLTNRELGLEVEKDLYRFLFLDEQKWQVIGSGEERQLVEQKLPEGMELQLQVDGLFSQFEQTEINKMFKEDEEAMTPALRPQIYLMSSGELNPFILVIGYDDETPIYYQIEASYDGKINLSGPTRESMSFDLGKQL